MRYSRMYAPEPYGLGLNHYNVLDFQILILGTEKTTLSENAKKQKSIFFTYIDILADYGESLVATFCWFCGAGSQL